MRTNFHRNQSITIILIGNLEQMYVQQLKFSVNYKKYPKKYTSNFDADQVKARIWVLSTEVKSN